MNYHNLSVPLNALPVVCISSKESKSQFLADKIKDRLKEKGLSRQDFAKLMEVQPSIVTRWLGGQHNFTINTIFDIERVLGFYIVDYNTPKGDFVVKLHLTVTSSLTEIPNSRELFDALEKMSNKTVMSNARPVTKDDTMKSIQDDSYYLPDQVVNFLLSEL